MTEKETNNMHEMIISLYDCGYGYSVAIDGVCLEIPQARDIADEYSYKVDVYGQHGEEKITLFMEKHNCNRLIVCEDGGIEVYENKHPTLNDLRILAGVPPVE